MPLLWSKKRPDSLPFQTAQEPSIYMAHKVRPTRWGRRCSGLCVPFLMLFLSLLPFRVVRVKECCCQERVGNVMDMHGQCKVLYCVQGNKLLVQGLMGVRIGNRSIPQSSIKATLPVSQEFTVSLCSLPYPTPTPVLFSSAPLCLLILNVAFKWLTHAPSHWSFSSIKLIAYMTGPVDKAVKKPNKRCCFSRAYVRVCVWGWELGEEGRYKNKQDEYEKYILHHMVKSVPVN